MTLHNTRLLILSLGGLVTVVSSLAFAQREDSAHRDQQSHQRELRSHEGQQPSRQRELDQQPPRRGAPPTYREGPGWQGEIHRFHDRDIRTWHEGHWVHDRHAGRLGWWWIVGGTWYFYPEPIYPYPNPYLPPAVVLPSPVPTSPAPQQYWYYCESAKEYYPYTLSCPERWKIVPATPPTDGSLTASEFWYYCESAKEYYPYVPTCPEAWKAVPATPAPPPPDAKKGQ